MKVVLGFVVGIVAFLVLILVEMLFLTNEVNYSATVVDKHYQSQETHTGTGVGMTTGGNATVVVTSSTTPEKFILGIKLSNGEYGTIKVPAEIYYEVKKSDDITFVGNEGSVTGIYHYTSKIKIND